MMAMCNKAKDEDNKMLNDHPAKFTSNSDSNSFYSVHFVQPDVIETLFHALPTETSERRREQERRRKFKEKLLLEHPEKLVLDSSYVNTEGKEQKQYTNSLLVTEYLDSWEKNISDEFCKSYIKKCKVLSNGHQLIFTNDEGEKYLTFSFYPSKNKLMTQGNHVDIVQWIDIYTSLSVIINCEITTAVEKSNSSLNAPREGSKKEASLTNTTSQLSPEKPPGEQSKVVDGNDGVEENENKDGDDNGTVTIDNDDKIESIDNITVNSDACGRVISHNNGTVDGKKSTKPSNKHITSSHSSNNSGTNDDGKNTNPNKDDIPSSHNIGSSDKNPHDVNIICVNSDENSCITTDSRAVKEVSINSVTVGSNTLQEVDSTGIIASSRAVKVVDSNGTTASLCAVKKFDTHVLPTYAGGSDKHTLLSHRQERQEMETDSLNVPSSEYEPVLFQSPKKLFIDSDKEADSPALKRSGKTYTSTIRRRCDKSLPTLRRSIHAQDSVKVHIKRRLDSLEAIVCGLQGGILKVVDSVNGYQDNIEKIMAKNRTAIEEKITSMQKKDAPMVATKHGLLKGSNGTVDELSANSVNVLSEKLARIEKKMAHLEQFSKLQRAVDNITVQMDLINKKLSGLCHCSKDMQYIRSSLEHIQENSQLNTRETITGITRLEHIVSHAERTRIEETERILEVLHVKPTSVSCDQQADITVKMKPTQHAATAEKQSNLAVRVPNTSKPVPVPNTATKTSTNLPARPNELHKRRVLLVGDSTSKLIDKRQLLRNEIISKCRAATIMDAYDKICTGGTHEMQKVIYCIGLNDLRNGRDINQIVDSMKSLIDETVYKHPACYIYICSILPVHSKEIMRNKIASVNAQFENLQRYQERVYFINNAVAFQNHNSPWSLFEKDGVHPNQMGTQVMIQNIRKKLQQQQRAYHQFTSKPATPTSLSYASCISGRPTEYMARLSDADVANLNDIKKNHVTPTYDVGRPPPNVVHQSYQNTASVQAGPRVPPDLRDVIYQPRGTHAYPPTFPHHGYYVPQPQPMGNSGWWQGPGYYPELMPPRLAQSHPSLPEPSRLYGF